MFKSNGVLLKSNVTIWQGTPATWNGWPIRGGGLQWGAYGELYSAQLWVAVLVNKIANATARLPLKVYERETQGRREATSSPYSQLLRSPSSILDPFSFWQWVSSTLNIYGEAFLGKIRDSGGRPVELVPLHPTTMISEERDGRIRWEFRAGTMRREIERRDFVHFKLYNPLSLTRGLSPLEPLRSTLENEDGARRANSALWRNGGQPAFTLEHPQTLSEGAIARLAGQWADVHGGVDNWAKAVILEEGMKASPIPLNVEQLQYIEARKLNREECCAAFDVPPPVVHILDRATFSNITEQMRSMYRDTMAPKLKLIESTLEYELRDGSFKSGEPPDFGANVYAEFLMDEVLRGAFEARTTAYQAGINAGWITPAEVRELENLPYIEGSDRLLVNSTLQPVVIPDEVAIESDGQPLSIVERVNAATALIRAGFDPAAAVAAVGLDPITHLGLLPITVQSEEQLEVAPPSPAAVRSLLGRLGRCKSLDEIDEAATCPVALAEMVTAWKSAGLTIEAVRAHLAALLRSED